MLRSRYKAIKLFAEKGFENTTIQEIADSAGIGKGTVYEYFKTKEDILKEVSREFFTGFDISMINSLSGTDPVEKLTGMVNEFISMAESNEDLFIVYLELWLFNIRDSGFADIMEFFKETI